CSLPTAILFSKTRCIMSDKPKTAGKFSLPLPMKDTCTWPRESKCPVCSKQFNGAFAVLNAGALMGDGKGNGSWDDRLLGFFTMIWHGAHGNPDPAENDVYSGIDVVEDVQGGQYDLTFCSTSCMRSFLNACIDKLEMRVKRSQARNRRDLEKMKAERSAKRK